VQTPAVARTPPAESRGSPATPQRGQLGGRAGEAHNDDVAGE
jgi:hypothetical protein